MANHRAFTITLSTSNANAVNLLTLLLAQTGATPTDGMFPNFVSHLMIQAASGNGSGKIITIQDAATTDGGRVLAPGDVFLRDNQSANNTINLGEYVIKPSDASLSVNVDIEQN